jgi:hypothetical protein
MGTLPKNIPGCTNFLLANAYQTEKPTIRLKGPETLRNDISAYRS